MFASTVSTSMYDQGALFCAIFYGKGIRLVSLHSFRTVIIIAIKVMSISINVGILKDTKRCRWDGIGVTANRYGKI